MGFKKLKYIAGVLFVFLLILSTNLIDKGNFKKVQNSIENIFEDRLTTKRIIFDFTRLIHEKDMAIATSDSIFYQQRNAEIDIELDTLIRHYEGLKLTKLEGQVLGTFSKDLDKLRSVESQYIVQGDADSKIITSCMEKMKEDLVDLSEIQMEEGRREMSVGKKAIDNVELFTQIELYLLIFLAVLISFLILYTPKVRE